jgi:radical SAM-linked protein
VSEVRQRWRLVFSRGEEARYLSHLDAVRLWERAFRRGEIPVATSEGFSPRLKLIFAAPLQLGMLAEHELADLFLSERLTAPELRDRLAAGMPRGYAVVDLHDVWIGDPALAPQLAAADYRITLLNVEQARLEAAAGRLLAAERLPRARRKEARAIPYDLRPLLLELRARTADSEALPPDADPARAAGLWMRLRHTQDRGSGRVEEVVAALAGEMGLRAGTGGCEEEAAGADSIGEPVMPVGATDAAETARESLGPQSAGSVLEVVRPVRERLWLATELESSGAPHPAAQAVRTPLRGAVD